MLYLKYIQFFNTTQFITDKKSQPQVNSILTDQRPCLPYLRFYFGWQLTQGMRIVLFMRPNLNYFHLLLIFILIYEIRPMLLYVIVYSFLGLLVSMGQTFINTVMTNKLDQATFILVNLCKLTQMTKIISPPKNHPYNYV